MAASSSSRPEPSALHPPASSSSSPTPLRSDLRAICAIAADPAPLPPQTPSAHPLRHRFSSSPPSPAPPPFVTKIFDLVNDVATNAVISWNAAGNGFVVWDVQTLCQCLLPRYFRHGNFASFVRQLNTYGFRKIDSERWEFANDDFARGKRSLLENIRRKTPAGVGAPCHYHHQLQRAVGLSASGMLESDSEASFVNVERLALREELNGLKYKVCRLAQQLQNSEGELQTICHRLKMSRKCTQHMMAFVTQAVRDPAFVRRLSQQQPSSESLGMPKRQRIPGLMATSLGDTNRMMDVECASVVFDAANANEQSRMPMPLSPLQSALQDEACQYLNAQAEQGSPLSTAKSETNQSSNGYGAPAGLSAFAAPQLGKSTFMQAGMPAEFLLHSKDAVLQYKWDVEGPGAALVLEDGHDTFARECTVFADSASL